ncbi:MULTISPECIES: TetR/AcrR family transcriptional regulator [Arthrobacter]|uniref:TetR/AcrR family transcriptional regulator n=1 Tax=Arthrobacter TaxID=1663 RepID=UPI001648B6E0|nr:MULTISPECIES: TetR/AcrR family transcriptional regulator [Arthrobacter]
MRQNEDPFRVVRASKLPEFKEPVRQAVIVAAEKAFFENGYHGTSMRSISAGAGVTVGAPYYHYDSKQAILREIMDRFMRWSLQTTLDACAAAPDDPYSQLVTAVRSHVFQHATQQVPSFVVDNELRSLETENRQEIVRLRDEIQGIFTRAVQRGHDEGIFETPFPRESARAIVTMCTSVASWFKTDGDLSAVDVAERYTTICLDAVRFVRPESE